MARIVIIIPMFEYENKLIEWQNTFIKNIYPRVQKELGISKEEIGVRYLKAHEIVDEKIIKTDSVDNGQKIIETVKRFRFGKRVGKGYAIRTQLEHEKEVNPEYIICIDGDRQISDSGIIDCLKKLDKEDFDAVLSERIGESGTSIPREIVEKFELSLVENKYNVKLPDGQCGCWAFKYSHHDNNTIMLTADEFEIELDFLINVLKSKLEYDFIPVKVDESTETSFNLKHHLKKATFLMQTLNIDKETYCTNAKQFPKIPKEYIDILINDFKTTRT